MKVLILVLVGIYLVAADCGENAFDDLKKEYKTYHENADKISFAEFNTESSRLLQKFKDFQKNLGDDCQEQAYYCSLYVNLLQYYAQMDEGQKNSYHNTHTEDCFNNVILDVIGCSGEPTSHCNNAADNKFLECLNNLYDSKCESKFKSQFMRVANNLFVYSKEHELCNENHILISALKC